MYRRVIDDCTGLDYPFKKLLKNRNRNPSRSTMSKRSPLTDLSIRSANHQSWTHQGPLFHTRLTAIIKITDSGLYYYTRTWMVCETQYFTPSAGENYSASERGWLAVVLAWNTPGSHLMYEKFIDYTAQAQYWGAFRGFKSMITNSLNARATRGFKSLRRTPWRGTFYTLTTNLCLPAVHQVGRCLTKYERIYTGHN